VVTPHSRGAGRVVTQQTEPMTLQVQGVIPQTGYSAPTMTLHFRPVRVVTLQTTDRVTLQIGTATSRSTNVAAPGP